MNLAATLEELESGRCPRCHSALPADAPYQLCVRCLLDQVRNPALEKNPARTDEVEIEPERLGDTIGRYKLLQEIGNGGFGTVYLAEQTAPVFRRVAVKVIKLGMDTKQVMARFDAERQALALMDHPNIAKVLDAGATAHGRPYFVMEWVKGDSITAYCDRNSLTPMERLDLFLQTCRAVQHAHQKGIIHRDLKPSNILVASQDEALVVKVIDFGIAKAVAQRLTERTLVTGFGQIIGTPDYMSPEQAELTSLDVDTRSDIYSLGVLLYELLTGKTPFASEVLVHAGLDEMRRTILERDPPKPSTRLSLLNDAELSRIAKQRQLEPLRLIHAIRGDLDWIVMRCLEKDRARRYETANGLAMDLKRHLASEPVLARPPSQLYRFRRMIKRNRAIALSTVCIFVVLILGVAVSTEEAFRAKQATEKQFSLRRRAENSERSEIEMREQAQLNEKVAKSESIKNRQVADFLKDMLKEVRASVTRGLDTSLLRELLDNTAATLDDKLYGQPEVLAELREIIGDTYYALQLHPQARLMQREALCLHEKVFGRNDLATARLLEKLSASFGGVPDWDLPEAERLLRSAMDVYRKISGDENESMVRCLNALGSLRLNQQDPDGAELLFNQALHIGIRILGEGSLQLSNSLLGLGLILEDQGSMTEAEANFRHALDIKSTVLGDSHPDAEEAVEHLARVLHGQGKMWEAEKYYLSSLNFRRHRFGDQNYLTLWSQSALAILYACCDREREAEGLWRNIVGTEKLGAAAQRGLETLFLTPSLIPLASDSQQTPQLWSYTHLPPATNWTTTDFNDRAWPVGPALFGTSFYRPRTDFKSSCQDLWLRRAFELPAVPTEEIAWRAKFGDQVEIFLNGVQVLSFQGWTAGSYWLFPCPSSDRLILKPGRNIIAVHVRSDGGGAGVDVGLYAAPELRRGRLHLADVLSDLLQKRPGNSEILGARALLQAQCGDWKESAHSYSTLVELHPDNHQFYQSLAPMLVECGDFETYQTLRKNMLHRFRQTSDPFVADRMAKSSLLVHLTGTELTMASRLAETAVSGTSHLRAYPYFQFTSGLADYRQGRFDEARSKMERVLEKINQDPKRDVQALMVLSMAEDQLGERIKAQASFTRGRELAQRVLPNSESGNLGEQASDWAVAHILFHEAATLHARNHNPIQPLPERSTWFR